MTLQDLLVIALGTMVILFGWPLVEYLVERGPTWARSVRMRYVVVTSSETDEDEPENDPVPVLAPPPTKLVLADTDAVRASTDDRTGTKVVRLSQRMSDEECITWLAVQKTPEGKDRFSANKIADLVGGTRADVLNQIRAIRSLPRFSQMTPEQELLRRNLELDTK